MLLNAIKRRIFKRKILIAIAISLCVCFLVYQLISLKQLNVSVNLLYSHKPTSMSSLEFDDTDDHSYDANIALNVILGVMPKFYSLYRRKNNLFKCVLSGEEISFSFLNDNYCDCVDGSDEPSTNACPNNKFVYSFK